MIKLGGILMKKRITIFALIITLSSLMSCNKESNLILSGTIEASQYDVLSEVSGKVIEVKKNEGEHLKKGDEIVVIDSGIEELNKERNQILVDVKKSQLQEVEDKISESKKEQMELDIKQQKKLVEQSSILLDKYTIKAQKDGVLNYNTVTVGEIVKPGSVVGTIIDLSDLWINMYISQKYLDIVSLNDEIILKTSQGKKIKGKITYISDEAEFTPKNVETNEAKENTVFKVKIKILDSIDDLKPGMTMSANFGSVK
jgi:HlyD family secretion protein